LRRTPGAALERASLGDLEALIGLGVGLDRPPCRAELEREVGAGRLLLLRTARGIVAWCSIRVVADELHVEDLVVDPGCRRQGWGWRLLARVLDLGRRRGARSAHLEVRRGNRAALELYRRAGFEVVGERRDYYRLPVEDALLMTLRVADAPHP